MGGASFLVGARAFGFCLRETKSETTMLGGFEGTKRKTDANLGVPRERDTPIWLWVKTLVPPYPEIPFQNEPNKRGSYPKETGIFSF